MKKIAIIILLFISANVTKATDYHVATNGNDNNSGTENNPFLTFEKGVSKLKDAGDKLFIHAGVYRGGATLEYKNGTTDNHIVISAYNGENVTIKGSKEVTGLVEYTGAQNGAKIYKKTGWSYESQMVFIDGVPLQQTGAPAEYIDSLADDGNWMIHDLDDPNSPYKLTLSDLDDDGHDGMFFYDKDAQVLYIRLVGDASPTGKLIEASTEEQLLNLEKSTYIEVKDLKFRHCNSSVRKPGAGMIELGSYCIIDNCDIQWADQAGVAMGYGKTGSKVINSVLNNNGNTGITASKTYNFTVENCEINYNNTRKFNTLWHAGGIKCVTDAYGDIIDCEVANNYGSGIWYDYCDAGEEKIVSGNYIHDNGPKHAGIFLEVSDNLKVYNNIVDNNTRIGIAIEGADDVKVYNNEIMNTHGVAAIRIIREGTNNNEVYNNVLYNNSSASADISIQVDGCENNHTGYNLFYNKNGSYRFNKYNSSTGSSTTTNSLATWQSWGFGEQDLINNPGYIVGAKGDVKKNSSSRVIDKGKYVSFVTNDYYGTSRPKWDGIDIGAFECAEKPEPNEPPVADAGGNKTVYDSDFNGTEIVQLDGSGSYDSDGSIVEYAWYLGDKLKSNEKSPSIKLFVGANVLTLTVTDDKGYSSSDEITVTVTQPQPNSISQNKDNEITIYPNPISDYLNIKVSNLSGIKSIVSIVDISGKIVYREQVNLSEISTLNLEQIKSGIYTLVIKNISDVYVSKIVVE